MSPNGDELPAKQMGTFYQRCHTSQKTCSQLGRGSHGQAEVAWTQEVAHGLGRDQQHCGRDPGELLASKIWSYARQKLCVDVANGSAVEIRNVASLGAD